MYKVAIVEDDKAVQAQFNQYLRRYEQENGEAFEVRVFNNGLEFIESYTAQFDVVLMDIEMPLKNGMEAARRMREIDSYVILVFITNMAQYALNGYEVSARDFILKPSTISGLASNSKKALTNASRGKDEDIAVKSTEGLVFIRLSELYYIESEQHYVTFYTMKGTYRARISISELNERLGQKNFAKCNTSFLVNLAFVKKIVKNTVYVGTYQIAMTRARKENFLNALAIYLGGGKNG